jgi:hypothetical protein
MPVTLDIDTDLGRNIKRVSPWLGVLLVISLSILLIRMIFSSVNDLTAQLNPGDAIGVVGTITLKSPSSPQYGNLVQFSSTATGDMARDAHTYIVTTCFQGDKLVYQLAAQPGVKFHLTDMLEPGYEWNGGAAECNASLIYRVPKDGRADLYMLNSTSFSVAARS